MSHRNSRRLGIIVSTACVAVAGLLTAAIAISAPLVHPGNLRKEVPPQDLGRIRTYQPGVKPCVTGGCDLAQMCHDRFVSITQGASALQTSMAQTQSCLQASQIVTGAVSDLQAKIATWNQTCRLLPLASNPIGALPSMNQLVDSASAQAAKANVICSQGRECISKYNTFVSHIIAMHFDMENHCDDQSYFRDNKKKQSEDLLSAARYACHEPFANMHSGAMTIAENLEYYGLRIGGLDLLCSVSWPTRCPEKSYVNWVHTVHTAGISSKKRTVTWHFRYCYEPPDVQSCSSANNQASWSVSNSAFSDFALLHKDVDLDINVCCAQDKCAADAQSMKATIDAFISSH
jgi:hypothetical protein